MPVVLGHSSARDGWLRTGIATTHADKAKLPSPPKECAACDEYFTHYVPTLGSSTIDELSRIGFSLERLDILTRAHEHRRIFPKARCRSQDYALPPGSILRMSGRVAIASPELTFLESACEKEFSFEKLIKFGYEICGRYALVPAVSGSFALGEEGGFPPIRGAQRTELVQIEPRTTADKITAYLDAIERLNEGMPHSPRGIRRARRALKHVIGVVESPLEADIAILEFAPARLGGNAVIAPECNAIVNLPAEMVPIVHRRYFRCDFLWREEKLVLEANGGGHSDMREMRRDAEKYNALRELGYNVLIATSEHVRSRMHTDALAEQLRGFLNTKPPRTRYDHDARKTHLRAELGLDWPNS